MQLHKGRKSIRKYPSLSELVREQLSICCNFYKTKKVNILYIFYNFQYYCLQYLIYFVHYHIYQHFLEVNYLFCSLSYLPTFYRSEFRLVKKKTIILASWNTITSKYFRLILSYSLLLPLLIY